MLGLKKLLDAQRAYDREIHAAVGDEKYQRYRDYEDSKPSRREDKLLEEFAARSNNQALDPAYSEKIIALFKVFKATTTESWHGPYDPRPHPEVGQEKVLAELNRQLAVYRPASSNLVEALPKTDLPKEYQQILREYCSDKVAELERQIVEMSLPRDEIIRRNRLRIGKEIEEQRLKEQSLSLDLPF